MNQNSITCQVDACKVAYYMLAMTIFSNTLSCQALSKSILYLHGCGLIGEAIINSILVPYRIPINQLIQKDETLV